MNHSNQIFAMILISYAGVSFGAGEEQALAVKTDGLPLHVAVKVKDKASEGVTSLRRYVYITRSMHNLDMRSLVRDKPGTEIAAASKLERIAAAK